MNFWLKSFARNPFGRQTSGACIIKLITAVICGFRNKLECLSLNTRLCWKGVQSVLLYRPLVDCNKRLFILAALFKCLSAKMFFDQKERSRNFLSQLSGKSEKRRKNWILQKRQKFWQKKYLSVDREIVYDQLWGFCRWTLRAVTFRRTTLCRHECCGFIHCSSITVYSTFLWLQL